MQKRDEERIHIAKDAADRQWIDLDKQKCDIYYNYKRKEHWAKQSSRNLQYPRLQLKNNA